MQDNEQKEQEAEATPTSAASFEQALLIESVEINSDCVGFRWEADDISRLAALIAIIAMGQAKHAAKIIRTLEVAEPAIAHDALIISAKRELQIWGSTDDQRKTSRWRRDGFLFEAISWIAARQANGDNVLLNDPHLKSTTQGVDGLMIKWDSTNAEVVEATILEDKCSGNPRSMFRDEVLPAFHNHHMNHRGPELVAMAASLIEQLRVDGTQAVEAAGRVLDLAYRHYRAALAITADDDTLDRRRAVFNGYDELAGLNHTQRIGATFVVDGELRSYFDSLAEATLKAIDDWKNVDV